MCQIHRSGWRSWLFTKQEDEENFLAKGRNQEQHVQQQRLQCDMHEIPFNLFLKMSSDSEK